MRGICSRLVKAIEEYANCYGKEDEVWNNKVFVRFRNEYYSEEDEDHPVTNVRIVCDNKVWFDKTYYNDPDTALRFCLSDIVETDINGSLIGVIKKGQKDYESVKVEW